MKTNTYITTEFTGHWPVGVSAVVNAETASQAAEFLNAELKALGLKGDATAKGMKRWNPRHGNVIVLQDGNY
jgi:hypothetical protein